MNWLKKLVKKEIDERQQADLNRITSYGYWIAFYLLLADVLIKGVILDRPLREWGVEWLIFMILGIYEVAACMKIGVWSSNRQKPGKKDYVRYSLCGSLLFSVIFTLGYSRRLDAESRTFANIAPMFAYWFILLLILFLIAYFISGGIFNRKRKRMEEEMEREDTEDEDE